MVTPKKSYGFAFVSKYAPSCTTKQSRVVLLGDSLVANLARYPAVWDEHLYPLHTVNCGIGGDRTQNVMWRIENMFLPATTIVGVIHCDINDIQEAAANAYGPHEIAENVILCGSKLKERHHWISIIIMGILPTVETFRGRNSRIMQINSLLEKACESRGFLFFGQASCWRDLDTRHKISTQKSNFILMIIKSTQFVNMIMFHHQFQYQILNIINVIAAQRK